MMEHTDNPTARAVEEYLEQLYVSQVEQAAPGIGALGVHPLPGLKAGPPPEGEGSKEDEPPAEHHVDAPPLPLPPPEARREVLKAKYAELRGGQCVLTQAGLEAARSVVRRHRLAECLLRDVLGVSDSDVDADACEFEHIIRHGLEERICLLLGHPRECPHGKPIPKGLCCDRLPDAILEVGPLSDGRIGADGVVVYLRTRDRRDVQKLMALGILPGVPIRLIRRFPSYVFQLGFSQFTVDRDLAEKIHVRWEEPASSKDAKGK
jgi:DtxR family transcriptional regulator, Mn-dependent transcriptional regulator